MLVTAAHVAEHRMPRSSELWPFDVPCIAELLDHGLELTAPLTFLVGENGSGKSTLIEAIADAFKLDSYGGKAGRKYTNDRPKTPLGEVLELRTTPQGSTMLHGARKKRHGFFLRAETAFGLMNAVSGRLGYWEADTSTMSHGEGFLTVFENMFSGPGLYLLDEPEAALSFTSCLRLVSLMHELGQSGAQIICATHSPVLAATPGADIIELGDHGTRHTKWDDLTVVALWRRYLADPMSYLREIAP